MEPLEPLWILHWPSIDLVVLIAKQSQTLHHRHHRKPSNAITRHTKACVISDFSEENHQSFRTWPAMVCMVVWFVHVLERDCRSEPLPLVHSSFRPAVLTKKPFPLPDKQAISFCAWGERDSGFSNPSTSPSLTLYFLWLLWVRG